MRQRLLLSLAIVQGVILILIVMSSIRSASNEQRYECADLKAYMAQFVEGNNYIPSSGYVPDAKTARAVGSSILDTLIANRSILGSSVEVQYDEKNRLWRVGKSYLLGGGGFVIIEQDSGRIRLALLSK